MKIFSAQQMRMADEATIQSQKITSLELMEHAATKVFNFIHKRLQGAPIVIHVFCGLGNNGGDGLVISRLLVEHGYTVKVYIVNFSDNRSKEFLANYDRLKEIAKEWPLQIKSEDDFPEIKSNDIVIDAIFGIGLSRPLLPWVILLIKHINSSRCFVISVDVPSGLYADKTPDDPQGVVFANITITFQTPKLIFFLPQTGMYTQDLEVIDIGLNQNYLQQQPAIAELISKNEIVPLYRARNKYSHKGTFGHSIIVGGSYGKIGSVVLATKAALRTGAGLITAYMPECGYDIIQTTVPEAMVITDDDDELSEIRFDFEPTAVAIGVGLGTSEKTIKAFKEFLKENTSQLVIDADGINIVSKHPELLENLKENTILTPHPKELQRLIGEWNDDFEKIEKTKLFSQKHHCIIIIKGANSMVIYGDRVYINTSGNPGMATAGSGDVLTGIITGLLSQGYDPLQATVFGVYLHGSAGDIVALKTGFESLIASDIVSNIGLAFLELFKTPESRKD